MKRVSFEFDEVDANSRDSSTLTREDAGKSFLIHHILIIMNWPCSIIALSGWLCKKYEHMVVLCLTLLCNIDHPISIKHHKEWYYELDCIWSWYIRFFIYMKTLFVIYSDIKSHTKSYTLLFFHGCCRLCVQWTFYSNSTHLHGKSALYYIYS